MYNSILWQFTLHTDDTINRNSNVIDTNNNDDNNNNNNKKNNTYKHTVPFALA